MTSQISDEATTEDRGSSRAPIGVVICDDGKLNRECLALALRSHGMIADCVWDLPSLFSQLDSGLPDVFVLNIGTPDSATLLQVVLDSGAGVRVIVIGLSVDRESEIVSCAEAGVAGLHLRTESLNELLVLIRNPVQDEARCSPEVSAILLRRVYSLAEQQNPEFKDPMLTDRENQILQLMEQGLSNQQIASRLNVSIHTVKNHARSIFSKLGVNSRAAAVVALRAKRYSDVDSV